MDEEAVVPAHFVADLADCLKKGLAFDITGGSPYLSITTSATVFLASE
jgi:hypothetical protein